nr:hypothetical protein [Tanacetum cinerariifolium]
MLHICPRVHGQSFAEPPFEEEILAFIRFLRHSAAIKMLTDVNINNLRLSQAQILWGLYHKRNIDYDYLMWEDFVYQVKHKNYKKSNEMHYPRFTKVIIHHFMSKDPSIARRNKFGALLPIELTNEEIKNSNAYKEYYAIATGAAPPKPKARPEVVMTHLFSSNSAAGLRVTSSQKGKQAAKASKAKSLSAFSEVAMTEAQQLKLVTKRTKSLSAFSEVAMTEAQQLKLVTKRSDADEGKDGDGDEEDDGDDGQ